MKKKTSKKTSKKKNYKKKKLRKNPNKRDIVDKIVYGNPSEKNIEDLLNLSSDYYDEIRINLPILDSHSSIKKLLESYFFARLALVKIYNLNIKDKDFELELIDNADYRAGIIEDQLYNLSKKVGKS